MPGLTRLAVAEPFETWPVMEQAAAQRFWDALSLATSEAGHEACAIYLLGYVAEMLLKTAYCTHRPEHRAASARRKDSCVLAWRKST